MKSSTRRFSLLVALAVGLTPAIAETQSKGDKKRAVQLSREAIKKYKAQDFSEAGDLFLEAYRLSKRKAQLRNAAKAFEEAGELDRALDLWKKYARSDALTRDEESEAEAHIALIKERQKNEVMVQTAAEAARSAELAREQAESARRAAEEARETSKAKTTVSSGGGSPVGGWVLLGTGAVVAIAGTIVWFVAQSQLSTLDTRLATTDNSGLITGTTFEEVGPEVDSINGKRIAAGVLLPIGLAAAGAGVLWVLLSGPSEVQPTVAITDDGWSGGLHVRY